MITVDIISPGGAFTPAAVGDAQELTTTFSISIGSPTLTCNGASPFVPGDTGKKFIIQGPGSIGATATWLAGSMTYVSANQVTLSVNATKALATASAYMAWGTDDAPAFRAFNTWAQAQADSVTLTLGSGAKKFLFASADSDAVRAGSMTWGVPYPITIDGDSPTTTKFINYIGMSWGAARWLKSGDSNFGSVLSWSARLDTLAAGALSCRCKTLADATQFTSNTWAMLAGQDLMGTGQPPNPFLFEFVYMTNVNTGSGVITFQSATQNGYLDTWSAVNAGLPGSQPDHGGPATLYALDPGWNVTATLRDLGVTNAFNGQSATKLRDITFQNVKWYDTYGLFPTGTQTARFVGSDLTGYQMEVDKCTENTVFDSTTTGQLNFQSSCGNVIIQNNSNITNGLNGTPKNIQILDSTVNTVLMGAHGFGRTDSFVTRGSTFTGALNFQGVIEDGTDYSGSTTVLTAGYTMSASGVITMPRAGRQYPGVRWATVGARCYFDGRETSGSLRIVDWGPGFTILSVTSDATNIYVQTDWPYTAGFPSWVKRIRVAPSKLVSFGADTVSSVSTVQNLMAATAAGRPYPGTYSFASLNNTNCGTDIGSAQLNVTPPTGGKLVRLTVTVTTPYTGVNGTLNWGKATQFILAGDGSSFITWNPRFDLRTPGTRVITPSGVAGSVGADSLSAPTSGAWLTNWLSTMSTGSANITSESGVGPVFTVELIVDQGIAPAAVAPLRLRLRAT